MDASPAIGAGHVTRCLSLAKVMASLRCECAFAIGPETLATVPALDRAGFETLIVDTEEKNAARLLKEQFQEQPDWLVIDHYGIDAASEASYRTVAHNLMVIDDLADKPHDCDLLLDQGPGRVGSDYAGLVPLGAVVLAGPAYALLDPAFGDLRDNLKTASNTERTDIFVSFGSTDPGNFTLRGLAALDAAGASGRINVVLGAAAPHRTAVEQRMEPLGSGAKLHIDTNETISLLSESSMAIGAGGVSALERSCCGVPSLVTVTAANQRAAAEGLSALGAARQINLDDTASAADTISNFLLNAEARAKMSHAAQLLCDGRGARRVSMALMPERSVHGDPVSLRPATLDDEDLMLAWQQFPGARRFARNVDAPDRETHTAWIRDTLDNPESMLNVIECNGAVGVLRLDRRPYRGDLAAFEVSLLIKQDRYRGGIGKAALALARRLVPGAILLAEIHPDNAASIALFRGSGYEEDGDGYACHPART